MNCAACMFCERPASYSCTCQPKMVYFCKYHRDTHETSIGDHIVFILKETTAVDPRSKKVLIQKINSTKKEAEKQSGLIIKQTSETILLLQTQTIDVLSRLKKFISTCDEVIQEIIMIQTIDYKKIHTPLESALIKNNADHILTRMAAPVINFFKPARFFSYTPSFFPHFFYNYSDLSICTVVKNVIEVFPSGKKITCKKFRLSSRMMNIGLNQLLVTGGNNENKKAIAAAFILDIESEEATEIAPLNIPRCWHSMTWIQGNPAVIGGCNNGNRINSVEVFENNSWVEIRPLNIARDSCTSISIQNLVWVIGGFTQIYLDSIEKYYRGVWTLVKIRLPMACTSVGLCSIGADLILFGGKTANQIKLKNVYYFNTVGLDILELKELGIEANFWFNQFFLTPYKLSALGVDGNEKIAKIIYEVSEISFQ